MYLITRAGMSIQRINAFVVLFINLTNLPTIIKKHLYASGVFHIIKYYSNLEKYMKRKYKKNTHYEEGLLINV